MPKFNHAFGVAFTFTVISEHEDASDVTEVMFREALLTCIRDHDLDRDGEWRKVMCDKPFNTYKMED